MSYTTTKSSVPVGFDPVRGLELYNTKIKIYPDGKKNIIYSNRQIFHPDKDKPESDDLEGFASFDEDEDVEISSEEIQETKTLDKDSVFRDDVLKRNRERVFDIVYCNDWQWFLTITFDPKQVDFTNVPLVMNKLKNWLDNLVRRHGLKYILVPERFKKTDGIHCHALVNDSIDTVYSGRVRVGKKSYTEDYLQMMDIPYTDNDKIYNCTSWKYGFSTALPVSENCGKLSVYLTKYITKGNDRIFGRYYWSSRNIVREPDIEYTNSPYDEIELPEFAVPNTSVKVKYDQQFEYTLGSTVQN